MKKLFLYGVLGVAMTLSLHATAQEVTVGGSNIQNSGVVNQLQSLKQSVQIQQNEFAKSLACANAGKIYAPSHAEKDANGCVDLALQSELDALETDHDTRISDLETRMTDAENRITTNENNIATNTAGITKNAADIQSLWNNLNNRLTTIETSSGGGTIKDLCMQATCGSKTCKYCAGGSSGWTLMGYWDMDESSGAGRTSINGSFSKKRCDWYMSVCIKK